MSSWELLTQGLLKKYYTTKTAYVNEIWKGWKVDWHRIFGWFKANSPNIRPQCLSISALINRRHGKNSNERGCRRSSCCRFTLFNLFGYKFKSFRQSPRSRVAIVYTIQKRILRSQSFTSFFPAPMENRLLSSQFGFPVADGFSLSALLPKPLDADVQNVTSAFPDQS